VSPWCGRGRNRQVDDLQVEPGGAEQQIEVAERVEAAS
jgi:hypothetical protein